MSLDKATNRLLQFADTGKNATVQSAALQLTKPALHGIQPRGAGWCEVKLQTAHVIVPELSDPVTLNYILTVTDGALEDTRSGQLQIVPRNTPKPGLISCLFNVFQDGCPLQLVGDLIGG